MPGIRRATMKTESFSLVAGDESGREAEESEVEHRTSEMTIEFFM